MTRYLVESGLTAGPDPLWQPMSWPLPDEQRAQDFLHCQESQWPERYGPGGNRQLRVRPVGP